jgi:NAD(P)H dehydrogenase (quinone)
MKSRRGLSFAGGLILASLLASTGCAQEPGADERIIVSGASGNLGGLTVEALLERSVPADRLILVSRTPERLAEYARMGASTRYGDFTEPESLAAAYDGGTRMLLISIGGGNLPEPRPELHRNAIDAAVAAGGA